jgi:hypothetical protein
MQKLKKYVPGRYRKSYLDRPVRNPLPDRTGTYRPVTGTGYSSGQYGNKSWSVYRGFPKDAHLRSYTESVTVDLGT